MKVNIEIRMTGNGLLISYEMNCELNCGFRKYIYYKVSSFF